MKARNVILTVIILIVISGHRLVLLVVKKKMAFVWELTIPLEIIKRVEYVQCN